jgi:hypothetical protein
MRDELGKFGNITLADKDTKATSADYLDLGAFQDGSKFSKHSLPDDLYICFRNTTAFETSDSYIPQIEWDTATGFATALKTLSYPQSAAELPAGTIIRYKVPRNVTRYVRAAATPKSTSTFGSEVVEAWLEEGPNEVPA